MEYSFIKILDFLGTFTFAISGIRLASRKDMDLFGAYIIGLVTAIGGGTTRDILLNQTPFWMIDPSYVLITGLGLLATLVFREGLFRWGNTLFLFDAIGLGLFTIVGIEKAVSAGFPIWVCVMMGAITGSVGGVIRDVLINEIPLLFRKDIYALASVSGGMVYFGGLELGVDRMATQLVAALSIICIRVLAVRYHIQLPRLKSIEVK